jgi:hypothetical protein
VLTENSFTAKTPSSPRRQKKKYFFRFKPILIFFLLGELGVLAVKELLESS